VSVWKVLGAIIIASIAIWFLNLADKNEDNFKPDTVKVIKFVVILIAVLVGYSALKNVL
jgi:hypothetical protein